MTASETASGVTTVILRVLRTLLIALVVIAAIAAGGYFLLPPRATATKTFTVARPAETAFVFLASTPAGAAIAKGVTQTAITSAQNNVVAAEVTFPEGPKGTATYTISPKGDGAQIALKVVEPLGPAPLERVQALTGGKVKPLVDEVAATITTQIGSLKTTSFKDLQYSIVEVLAQPFFFIENCTSRESRDITAIVNQAVHAIPPLMHANKLKQDGPLIAVEPKVVQGQYCYQVGYRYTGAKPAALLVGKFSDSPSGTALRVVYTGTEDKVVSEVYDKVDALLAAIRLDDPSRSDDDWVTFEVYNDDPTQTGGSRNRDIYYMVPPGTDLTRLKEIAPPKEEAPAAGAGAVTDSPAGTATSTAPASASSASESAAPVPASTPPEAPASPAAPPATPEAPAAAPASSPPAEPIAG